SRVGQIDVCELAVGELVYKTAVSFYPGSRAQGLLVGHRDYRRLTRAFERWTAVDGQHGLPIRRAVEQTGDVVGRFQLNPIDSEDVIADRDIYAGAAERRAQVGVPALVVVDAGDLVTAVINREVGAEQSAGRLRHVRHVAAADVRMADGDLGAHVVEQIVEVG